MQWFIIQWIWECMKVYYWRNEIAWRFCAWWLWNKEILNRLCQHYIFFLILKEIKIGTCITVLLEWITLWIICLNELNAVNVSLFLIEVYLYDRVIRDVHYMMLVLDTLPVRPLYYYYYSYSPHPLWHFQNSLISHPICLKDYIYDYLIHYWL
jgi:hypothetical protein